MTDLDRYSSDWAKHFVVNARAHLMHLAERPVRCLEIGVFEGRSGRWMLENLLVHPESSYVGIDAWGWNDGAEEKARENLMPHADRVELRRGDSGWVLRQGAWEPESFDFAYIDGCHRALAVLTDSTLVWPLVKVGGLVVWDDYQWRKPLWKRNRRPKHLRPKEAIDAFLMAIRGDYDLLFKNYQVGVCKTANPPGLTEPA